MHARTLQLDSMATCEDYTYTCIHDATKYPYVPSQVDRIIPYVSQRSWSSAEHNYLFSMPKACDNMSRQGMDGFDYHNHNAQ